MKYIKTYEAKEKDVKFYWSTWTNIGRFKKSLEKIGCPKDEISSFLKYLKDGSYSVFVGVEISRNNIFWNLSESGLFFSDRGFEYKGPIRLSKDELEEIEIQEDSEKYNL